MYIICILYFVTIEIEIKISTSNTRVQQQQWLFIWAPQSGVVVLRRVQIPTNRNRFHNSVWGVNVQYISYYLTLPHNTHKIVLILLLLFCILFTRSFFKITSTWLPAFWESFVQAVYYNIILYYRMRI